MGPGAALSCPGMTLLDQLKKMFLHRVRGKYPGQLEIGSPSPPHPSLRPPGNAVWSPQGLEHHHCRPPFCPCRARPCCRCPRGTEERCRSLEHRVSPLPGERRAESVNPRSGLPSVGWCSFWGPADCIASTRTLEKGPWGRQAGPCLPDSGIVHLGWTLPREAELEHPSVLATGGWQARARQWLWTLRGSDHLPASGIRTEGWWGPGCMDALRDP